MDADEDRAQSVYWSVRLRRPAPPRRQNVAPTFGVAISMERNSLASSTSRTMGVTATTSAVPQATAEQRQLTEVTTRTEATHFLLSHPTRGHPVEHQEEAQSGSPFV